MLHNTNPNPADHQWIAGHRRDALPHPFLSFGNLTFHGDTPLGDSASASVASEPRMRWVTELQT